MVFDGCRAKTLRPVFQQKDDRDALPGRTDRRAEKRLSSSRWEKKWDYLVRNDSGRQGKGRHPRGNTQEAEDWRRDEGQQPPGIILQQRIDILLSDSLIAIAQIGQQRQQRMAQRLLLGSVGLVASTGLDVMGDLLQCCKPHARP